MPDSKCASLRKCDLPLASDFNIWIEEGSDCFNGGH